MVSEVPMVILAADCRVRVEPVRSEVPEVLPRLRALVLVVPMLIVPFVPLAVPTSMVILPELPLVTLPDWRVTLPLFDVAPVVLPDCKIVFALLVLALDVFPELTLFDVKASGTAVSCIRGDISPS